MKTVHTQPLDFIAVSSIVVGELTVVKRLERRIATGVMSLTISGVNGNIVLDDVHRVRFSVEKIVQFLHQIDHDKNNRERNEPKSAVRRNCLMIYRSKSFINGLMVKSFYNALRSRRGHQMLHPIEPELDIFFCDPVCEK